jgi:hypothetical protein
MAASGEKKRNACTSFPQPLNQLCAALPRDRILRPCFRAEHRSAFDEGRATIGCESHRILFVANRKDAVGRTEVLLSSCADGSGDAMKARTQGMA